MKQSALSSNTRPQKLEAVAYFDGAHGGNVKQGVDRIQAIFDQKSAEVNHDAVAREKKHESVLDRVRALLPDAEAKAKRINARVSNQMPQMIMPAISLFAALFMLVGEVALLAPSLDVLYVTNPLAQFVVATAVVLASCLAFHFAWESFTSDRFPRIWRYGARAIGAVVIFMLIAWGILRGRQVAFAADLNQNPLGGFLSGHPFLASVFYVFITLMTPLVVATATHFGFHHLRDWWELKRANARLRQLTEARVTAQKQLDAKRLQHQHALKQLAHECAQWKAIYQIHHARGAKHLAVQEPIALVYLKTAGVAILAGAPFFWMPSLAVCASVVAGIAAFVHFRHKREHPNPEEYFKVQNMQFAQPLQNVTPEPEPPLLEAKVESPRRRKGLPQ